MDHHSPCGLFQNWKMAPPHDEFEFAQVDFGYLRRGCNYELGSLYMCQFTASSGIDVQEVS